MRRSRARRTNSWCGFFIISASSHEKPGQPLKHTILPACAAAHRVNILGHPLFADAVGEVVEMLDLRAVGERQELFALAAAQTVVNNDLVRAEFATRFLEQRHKAVVLAPYFTFPSDLRLPGAVTAPNSSAKIPSAPLSRTTAAAVSDHQVRISLPERSYVGQRFVQTRTG